MSLASCSTCNLPVKLTDAMCPHCGGVAQHANRIGQAAIVLLMGLTSACSSSKPTSPQLPPPEYEQPQQPGTPSEPVESSNRVEPAAPSAQPSAPVTPPAAAYGVALTPSSSVSAPIPAPPKP